MMQFREEHGMPLYIWIRTFLIALVVLASAYFLLGFRDSLIFTRNTQTFHFAHHINSKNRQLDAYFVGSSLTNYALFVYHSLDSIMSVREKKFNYRAVTCGSVSLGDFNNRIDEIKKLRPKYLFIESNIVCVNMNPKLTDWLLGFRDRLARVPVYFIRMGKNAFQLINNFAADSSLFAGDKRFDLNDPAWENDYATGEKFSIRKINEFERWNKFYPEAEKLGIRVILLEIPRSFEAEQHLPMRLRRGVVKLIDQYRNQYHLVYLDFPYDLGRKKYYIDRGHFNRTGGNFYCSWLVQELCRKEYIKCNQ